MSSRLPSPPRAIAILLAAGDSERMGSPKALLDWRGRPLLVHQIEQLQRSRVAECVVVLGHESDRLEPLVRSPLRPGWKSRSIVNPRHAEGKCSSILAGLRSLPARPEALLIVSVDQPLTAQVVDALMEAAQGEWGSGDDRRTGGESGAALPADTALDRRTILVPSFGGRRGHPPLFHGSLLPEIFGIREETEGLKAVVRRLPGRVLELPWNDDSVLLNLNSVTDLERAQERGPRGTV